MVQKTLLYHAIHQYEKHQKNTRTFYKECANRIRTISFFLFCSQILELISLFVPLKVIIILGNNTVPSFISQYLKINSVEVLIEILVCITALTYLLSLALSVCALKLGASTLKTLTPVIKQEQAHLSEAAIKRTFIQYSEFLANLLLVMTTAVIVGLLTPFMFTGIVVLVSIELLLLQSLSYINHTYTKYAFAVLKNYAREFSQYIVAINFAMVMIIIIIQYKFNIPIKTLPTIFAFMMARKMFSSARNVVLYLHRVV